MTLVVDNPRSSIVRELMQLLPGDEQIATSPAHPWAADRYLFCGGFLAGETIAETSREDVARSYFENFSDIAATCDLIIENNAAARICIIGSESGEQGSYDMAYAGAKAAMHLYIRTKRLIAPAQQLVGISPGVIWNSGMTARRRDIALCKKRGAARRRGRWLEAIEVARLVHFALYVDGGAICNSVLRINGGTW